MKNYILLIRAFTSPLVIVGLASACIFVPSMVADTMHGQLDYPFGGGFQMCCRDDDVSNTFMFTRPIVQNTSTLQALWHNIEFAKKHDLKCSVQAIGVYQQSLSLERTKHYFLPGKIDNVLVTGDADIKDLENRQIRAEWLNLPSTFQGTFTLNPKQRQAGVIIEFNQALNKFSDNGFFENAWINILTPLVFVENNMHICQDVLTTTSSVNALGQPNPIDIIEAFQQKDWFYGKICSGSMTQTKLADISIQLGKTFLARDNFIVASYTAFVIPTGNIQNARYLFEPVSGNNGHFGYGAGVNFQVPITSVDSPNAVCFFLDFESIFFARNKQWRTFDLKCKPYSRYLQFVRRDDPNPSQGLPPELIPGVNILTQHVQVHPYNLADLSTGFRVKVRSLEVEIGYSIWGHGDEKIIVFHDNCLNNCDLDRLCDHEIFGIAGNQNTPKQLAAIGPCGNILPATASKSRISCQSANDVVCEQTVAILIGDCAGPQVDAHGDTQRVFVPITRLDIDLKSGARQSAFNHKFQCAVGLNHTGQRTDMFFGVGGYYDKPVKSGSLNVIGAWAKIGASF